MMVSTGAKISRTTWRVSTVLAAGVLAMTLGFPAAAQQKVSVEMGKPVAAAQEAIQKKNWAVAMEQIKAAQALAKTPYENYAADALQAFVLFNQQKFAEMAVVYERMLASGQMPANEVDARTKSLAQTYYGLKKYPEATKWLKKVLEKHPDDEEANQLLAQVYFQTNDFKSAAATAGTLIANAEKAGKAPKESWLRIVYNSYAEMGNKAGGIDSLRKLVRMYQQPDDWARLINFTANKSYPDAVSLSLLRLKLDTGVLKNFEDYIEFAQLASDAGAPNESQQIMEKGTKSGALKATGKVQQGKVERVTSSMQTQAATMRSGFAKMSSEAAAAADGQGLLKVGQIYTGDGKYDQAVDALQNSIKKGGLADVDEAQVNLGIALLKKGQKEQARQAFKAIKKDSKWADIAELWTVRAS